MNSPKTWLQWRYLVFAVFALVSMVRFVHLSADPSTKLTTSQGVYTDPAAYTLSARNASLFDDPNPIKDERFPLFERSAVSLLASVVYEVAGVSYGSGNFVALLFSLGTILALTLIIRHHVGRAAAVCTLLLLLLNQNQYHYGRLPFLENAMVFFGVVSFWLTLNFQTSLWRNVAIGATVAASFLFGKTHGIVFVPVVVATLVSCHRQQNVDAISGLGRTTFEIVVGALAVAFVWYLYVAQGSLGTIWNYLQEQSTGIYGTPEALQSWVKFFWKILSLGVITKLFSRMPIASIGATVAFGLILWRLFRGKQNNKSLDFWISPVIICLAGWFALTYFELLPWNYRPLRYQIPLIYATCALAGIWLGRLWSSEIVERLQDAMKVHWLRFIGFFVALSAFVCVPVYQFLSRRGIDTDGSFKFADNISTVIIVSILLAAIITALIVLLRRLKTQIPPRLLMQSIVVSSLAISLGYNFAWFENWLSGPTYTTLAVTHDLPRILGPGAVLSGPYGVGLSQENEIPAIVHQFGIADPDTSFFDNYPVTHLLMDEANMTRFQKMYPLVAAWSSSLFTYRVASRKVTLVKVAGHTGNPLADSYQPTVFENIAARLQVRDTSLKPDQIEKFKILYRESFAANLLLAKIAARDGRLLEAIEHSEAAAAFCPSDFNILINLGDLRFRLYEDNNDWALLQQARKDYEMALRFHPYSTSIPEKLAKANRAG